MRRYAPFCFFVAAATSWSASAGAVDFTLNSTYPIRSNSDRTCLGTSTTSNNAGINTADCLDVGTGPCFDEIGPGFSDCSQPGQYWTFEFTAGTSLPSGTNFEIWASTTNASCVDTQTYAIDNGTESPALCYPVARYLLSAAFGRLLYVKPIQMMAAVNGNQGPCSTSTPSGVPFTNTHDSNYNYSDVSGLDPANICVASDMSMTPFYLHFLETGDSTDTPTVVKDITGAYEELIYPSSTTQNLYYDLGGPSPPTDLGIGAGSQLIYLYVNEHTTITSGTDIQGYNAYCVAGSLADASTDSAIDTSDTSSDSEADTVSSSDDGAETDVGVTSSCTIGQCVGSLCAGGYPTGSKPCGSMSSLNGQIKITSDGENPLQNNTSYCVFVAGTDIQGNAGQLSEPLCTIPKPTLDFYTAYTDDGGSGGGGFCSIGAMGSQGSQALWGWWAALSFIALRRKTTR